MSEQIYSRAKELMEADLNGELVALDPVAGECFGFNPTATEIWKLLKAPKSEAELCASLQASFDVSPEQCAAELRLLLQDLVGRRLVEIHPA